MKNYRSVILCCIFVILGMSTLASTPLTRKKLTDEERIARREARKKEFNRYYGGFINDVRQQQGKISIVNAQKIGRASCRERV